MHQDCRQHSLLAPWHLVLYRAHINCNSLNPVLTSTNQQHKRCTSQSLHSKNNILLKMTCTPWSLRCSTFLSGKVHRTGLQPNYIDQPDTLHNLTRQVSPQLCLCCTLRTLTFQTNYSALLHIAYSSLIERSKKIQHRMECRYSLFSAYWCASPQHRANMCQSRLEVHTIHGCLNVGLGDARQQQSACILCSTRCYQTKQHRQNGPAYTIDGS